MNKSRDLHIVSLNIPYPANYGGIIDIFYKIKCLKDAGYSVHLHAFEYNRKPAKELEKYCKSVHYYKRKTGLFSFLSPIPYTVYSRRSRTLLETLLKDNYPILFEGLHCCYYLNHPGLTNHKKFVRTHNVEHIYYKAQSTFSRNFFERLFFLTESRKLKHYEKVLHNADKILAISLGETRYFSEKYGKTQWLSAFHSCSELDSIPGKGKYILMHGNLLVNENETAVIYALQEVLSSIDFPVIIAGQNPSPFLIRIIGGFRRVTFIESPNDEDLFQLIRNAHINLLITFQNTGLKLKLINALFKGRFVVVNSLMIDGTGLDELVYSGKDSSELIHSINELLDKEFDMPQIEKRRKFLKTYGNEENTKKLDQILTA